MKMIKLSPIFMGMCLAGLVSSAYADYVLYDGPYANPKRTESDVIAYQKGRVTLEENGYPANSYASISAYTDGHNIPREKIINLAGGKELEIRQGSSFNLSEAFAQSEIFSLRDQSKLKFYDGSIQSSVSSLKANNGRLEENTLFHSSNSLLDLDKLDIKAWGNTTGFLLYDKSSLNLSNTKLSIFGSESVGFSIEDSSNIRIDNLDMHLSPYGEKYNAAAIDFSNSTASISNSLFTLQSNSGKGNLIFANLISSTLNLNNVKVESPLISNAIAFSSGFVDEQSNADKTTINLSDSNIETATLIGLNLVEENAQEEIKHNNLPFHLNADNSKLEGRVFQLYGNSKVSVTLTLSNGSTWRMREDSFLANLNMSNSEVNLRSGYTNQFNTLTIDNLSGSGHFDLYSDLADQKSDKIVVKGKDSGEFTLGIHNSRNEPNAANGKVTLVETQQGQATFRLKDREYVDAGAYRYRLNKEGTNWVLSNRAGEKTSPSTSTVQPVVTPDITSPTETPTTPTETVVQPTTPIGVVPVTPPTDVVTPTPVVQSSIPVVPPSQSENVMLSEKSNALTSLRQAQSALVSQNVQGIHQRLGDLKTDKTSNVWVKHSNSRTEADAQHVAANSRSSGFEMDAHNLHIGADRAVSDNFRLGGFVGTNRADVDFNGEYGKGKLRSQAVGFYTIFANADGWYVDNVGKYERVTAHTTGEKRKYNAFSVSSEIGKRIAFGNDWTLTPQVQLAYYTINGKADESRLNLFSARGGMRVAKGFALTNGWNVQPYAEFNAIAEKTNNAEVRVNQYRFEVPKNRGRFQTAIGLSAGNDSHRLGLEASTTHGKQLKQPLALQVSYRYQW